MDEERCQVTLPRGVDGISLSGPWSAELSRQKNKFLIREKTPFHSKAKKSGLNSAVEESNASFLAESLAGRLAGSHSNTREQGGDQKRSSDLSNNCVMPHSQDSTEKENLGLDSSIHSEHRLQIAQKPSVDQSHLRDFEMVEVIDLSALNVSSAPHSQIASKTLSLEEEYSQLVEASAKMEAESKPESTQTLTFSKHSLKSALKKDDKRRYPSGKLQALQEHPPVPEEVAARILKVRDSGHEGASPKFRQLFMDDSFRETYHTRLVVTPRKLFSREDAPQVKQGSK